MGHGTVPGERVVTESVAHGKSQVLPVLTLGSVPVWNRLVTRQPSPVTLRGMVVNINITDPKPCG